jgi:hypothetical protein
MATELEVVSNTKSTDTPRIGRNRFPRTTPEAPEHGVVCKRLVNEAGSLVRYAATAGIYIDKDMRQQVFAAKQAIDEGNAVQNPSEFLIALTTLSKALKPVSAESLRQCMEGEAIKTLGQYKIWAFVLACVIVIYSIYAFVALATCEAITKDVETANALAVTLTADIQRSSGASAASDQEQLRNLQQFASTFRAIHNRALGLQDSVVLGPLLRSDRFKDPLKPAEGEVANSLLELPPDLSNHDYPSVVESQIAVYQKVREFAKDIQERVSTSFGAITAGLLPLLYALLGAMAYLIRSFDAQIKAHTFVGSHFWVARLFTAGIAGMVIGLFSGFGSDHGVSLSPLAAAFLVGYAVDPFFAFLDGLVETFTKRGAQAS